MVQVVLTDQQVEQIRSAAGETVQLCDSGGRVVAKVEPEFNEEFLAELKRRATSPGPWYTSDQVRRRLEALQKEWERLGGFDDTHMREYLEKLRQEDPGHMRN
ncbi:MAG: hypothetical protein L0215_14525 [Gemmataceae bacterium]|nr:hypothetical protein [Gemmataceae bacterium]